MAAIRNKNTLPEILVRSALHELGYRFRLHRKDLPGTPDVVLPKLRIAIFVHGCFWHCHDCRFGFVAPRTRADFWSEKRHESVRRDERKKQLLLALGWRVVTIWECETRDRKALLSLLKMRIVPS
jgi:DNA mismatch endonuclease (patch repair protein)